MEQYYEKRLLFMIFILIIFLEIAYVQLTNHFSIQKLKISKNTISLSYF